MRFFRSLLGRRDKKLFCSIGRTEAIGSAREVSSGEIGRRNMPSFFEASFPGQFDDLRRRKETDERRAVCAGAFGRRLDAGTYLGVHKLQRRHERHSERRSLSK